MSKSILTFGVTDLDCYPPCKSIMHCKEFLENDILCVPSQKPDIEDIDSVYASVYIKNFKIIKTIQGFKVIVEGLKKYKIMYTANTCEQSVHSAHWESCFCDFILLGDQCDDSCNICVHDIFIGIEDIVIKYNDNRIVDISLILVMYPIFANWC
jgi:hypothetical protein